MLSCSDSDGENSNGADTPIAVTGEEGLTIEMEEAVNAGINAFSFNLLRKMMDKTPQTSLVASPFSVASVLAMLNAGADGATRSELLNVLGFNEDGKTRGLNEFFQKQQNMALEASETFSTKFQTANALFVNHNNVLSRTYATDMKKYYNALIESIDFGMPSAVDHINSWCSEKTNGMIPQIVSELSPQAQAVVANAVCFTAQWVEPFDKNKTYSGRFTTEDGKQGQVEMMVLDATQARIVSCATFDALRMDYSGGQYSMTVLLPKGERHVEQAVASLSSESWADLRIQLDVCEPAFTFVRIPRFAIDPQPDSDITSQLQGLGIKTIFDEGEAEFPGILDKASSLYVSQVKHLAKIVVGENGTEASAASASVMEGSVSPYSSYPAFYADRPFVFVISNLQTSCAYFVGTFHG